MKSFVFGHTYNSLPIIAHEFGSQGPSVLILAGVHGDESEGVIAAHGLLDSFTQSFPYKLHLTIIPAFNLDGVIAGQRKNANGVDLNRNLPTSDWSPEIASERYHPGGEAGSEPETQALLRFLDRCKPRFIISLHSWKPMLNINGKCDQEAQIISELTGYEIKESIGYPTPGCLGTYSGLERNTPTLTYEIERGLSTEETLRVHPPAILEALKITESIT